MISPMAGCAPRRRTRSALPSSSHSGRGGDDRSHDRHRPVTGERARAGTEATGDAMGGRERQRRVLAPSRGNRGTVRRRVPYTADDRRAPAGRRGIVRGRSNGDGGRGARVGPAGACRRAAARRSGARSRGGYWIAPFVLVLAHADDDQARVSTEVIEWAKQHGSLPVFSMAAQLRAHAYLRCGSLAEAEADSAPG